MLENKPTEDNMTKYLMEQIDQELEKPFEEQDMNYIEECSQRLYQITGDSYDLEPSVRKESIEKIKCLAKKKFRKTILIKRLGIAAAAACLVLVMMGGGIAWADGDYSRLPFGDLLSRLAFILQPGEAVYIEDDTFYKPITYSTIEEFFEDQDVSVLYPTWLPEGVEVRKVDFMEKVSEGISNINIHFTDDSVTYWVFLYGDYASTNKELFTEEHLLEIDGNDYYVRTVREEVNAIFYRNGYSYSVTAGNLEDLQGILKGLEMKD